MYSLLYRGIISNLPDKWVESLGGPYFKIASYLSYTPMVDLPVEITGVTFPNPVGIPAGWIDNPSKLSSVHRLGVGIPTIKTITYNRKEGNPYPRIVRGKDQLINSMGLPNHGLQWWVEHYERPKYPTIFSIKGNTTQEWIELLIGLDSLTDIIELNFSCPNVGDGIIDITASVELIKDIVSVTDAKIFLKLSPEYSPEQNIQFVEKVRQYIEGVTAVNTIPTKNERLGNPTNRGGISGKPLYNTMLQTVKALRKEYRTMAELPILATGGIFTGEQAWEVLSKYRSIPMGLTGFLLKGPRYYYKLAKYIEQRILDRDDLVSINDLLY